ncbi:MAG: hypothetical protein WD066_05230 [Planctomycetaceae bacterium]
MDPLDELLTKPPSVRTNDLCHPKVRAAFAALGNEAAIAWLEEHIDSPIGPEWGSMFHEFQPDWPVYDRWIRLSKLHCLAAVDAILIGAPSPYFDDPKQPELPRGADAVLVNQAVDYALEHYGNPRLRDAAKRIRHTWPVGKPRRHRIEIPKPLARVARWVLGDDAAPIREWRDAMAKALDPPQDGFDFWDSLLDFCLRKGLIALVDWREGAEEIVAQLRDLPSAQGLPVRWEAHEKHSGDNEELFRNINADLAQSSRALVDLDTGGDSFALLFAERADVPTLCETIKSAVPNVNGMEILE